MRTKWLQLQCATNPARIRRDTGRCRKAQVLLSPVYDSAIEGFDTADLKDAKALLEGLRPLQMRHRPLAFYEPPSPTDVLVSGKSAGRILVGSYLEFSR
jgi:hypothetical protein